MLLKKIVLTVCLGFIFLSQTSFAEVKFSSEVATKAIANFMNDAKTPRELLNNMKFTISPAEFAGLTELIKKDLDAELPKCKAIKSDLICGEQFSLKINNNRSFSIGTKTYMRATDGELHEFIKKLKQDFSSEQASLFSLFLQPANASGITRSATKVATRAVATVMLAAVAGTVTAKLVIVGGAVAGIYAWQEISSHIRNGEVECKGRHFIYKEKNRMVIGLAHIEEIIISAATVEQVLGKPVRRCDKILAKEYQDAIPKIKEAKTNKEKLYTSPSVTPSSNPSVPEEVLINQ